LARARLLCEQSLALYRDLADPTGLVLALVQLARIAFFQYDRPARQAFLAEAASRIGALPDTVTKAEAYADMALAWVDHFTGESPTEAARFVAESERIQRALANPAGVAFAMLHQANIAVFNGDEALAAFRFDEAERLIAEVGDDRLLGRAALSR